MKYELVLYDGDKLFDEAGGRATIRQPAHSEDELYKLPKLYHDALAVLSAAIQQETATYSYAAIPPIGEMHIYQVLEKTVVYIQYDHYLTLKLAKES